MSPAPDSRRLALIISIGVMSAMVLSLLQPSAIPFDHEELYNAAHARLLQLGHWKYWLDLQYRGHCGGCTQHALLGAGLFKLFGQSLFVWKLIPVAYIGVMAYAGARILERSFGGPAAIAWGILMCFPYPTFLELSMTAWGNHFEASVAAVVVVHVALRTRENTTTIQAVFLGLVLAWALWIGFSSAFLVLALVPILWRRVHRRQLSALAIGLLPVCLLWSYQQTFALSGPFETIYYAGEAAPRLQRIPEKLWSLFAPRQLVALFSDATTPVTGWAVGLSVVVSAWTIKCRPTARVFFCAAGAFLLVYSTVRFTVWAPPAPEIAPPGSMRYAAPLYGLVWLILAAAAGLAWGRQQRWLAMVLLAPSLSAGISAKSRHLEAPFPDYSVFTMAAPDLLYARDQASYTISLNDHKALSLQAQDGLAFQRFAIAWHETREALNRDPNAQIQPPQPNHRASLEGIGAALLSELDGDERGGMFTLEAIEARLDGFSRDDRVRVLVEAARRREWTRPFRAGHRQDGLQAFNVAVVQLSVVAQQALTEDIGRRWAADLTRWRTPAPLSSPDVEGMRYPAFFARGYAETIGRRLGDVEADAPATLQAYVDAWTEGLAYGHDLQWLNQTR